MKKLNSIIGVAVGVVIIALAIVAFAYDVQISAPSMSAVVYEDTGSPSYELDKAYGGDAYTGMQQAAAQAANNLIPVFNAIDGQNDAIKVINKNLEKQARAEARNLESVVGAVKFCFGAILLSMGLITVAKHIGGVVEFIQEKKQEKAQEIQASAEAETKEPAEAETQEPAEAEVAEQAEEAEPVSTCE